MEKLTKEDLFQLGESDQFLYLYTPLCGTCQLAAKMLTIVEEAMPSLTIHSCDLNYIPTLAEEWKIESVPCLLFFKEGQLDKKVYAFQSVENLYNLFKTYTAN
ncbi:thioredoxin family protein [Metabacillus arenae]|uniref:Thioredoxin family protein n=1 Tax=Metabacillus arenae TaxID=2771434 RepID=A0A926RY38_9BACI|nr:thioredoxin family protein [Metabacillus arenae]MBD1380792.1 thioredoxin family protein [Metabacillus arenae]